MKKLILSLAIVIAPLGVAAFSAGPASADGEACYVDNGNGGTEQALNVQDQSFCEASIGGVWR